MLKRNHPDVNDLRDASLEMLDEEKNRMSDTTYRRCKYVVEENERLLKACNALERSDLNTFGRYMFQTHDGLSDGYEVSYPEVDYLVDAVKNESGVVGARMMGGGFGGCTTTLIERDAVDRISAMVSEKKAVRMLHSVQNLCDFNWVGHPSSSMRRMCKRLT